MAFNKDKVNLIVSPVSSSFNVREIPSVNGRVLVNIGAGKAAGRTSGYYFSMPDGNWYQVNLYTPVLGINHGYVREDAVRFITPAPDKNEVAESNSKQMIGDLTKNCVRIYTELQKHRVKISALKKAGVNTSAWEAQYLALLKDFVLAQVNLKTCPFVSVAEYKETNPELFEAISGVNVKRIGVVPVVLIVGVVVGLGLAALAYYALKPDYDRSVANLKVSKELEAALDAAVKSGAISEEERKDILADLEDQIDDAYNRGKTDQNFKTSWAWAKYLAGGLTGFYLIDKFLQRRERSKAAQA